MLAAQRVALRGAKTDASLLNIAASFTRQRGPRTELVVFVSQPSQSIFVRHIKKNLVQCHEKNLFTLHCPGLGFARLVFP